jgi:ABC-type multidrug transport system fused ATPase/permease subunit
MLGVREPTSGEVRVNGHPMTSLDRTTWTNLSALVPQTAHIISGSLADNVRFFREFDDETVASAIEAAGLTADLENLPKGSDTMVGSRGIQLSGGQAQRLAIARALVSDPSFIVLDEPTASLDSKSELRVRETLARLGEDATVIIVAHRMSTLEECDRIMVVEHGRVTAFGSRDDVLEQDNFFRSTLHPR